MKIYTRGGDKGKTSLLGGSRISKADRRIDAYGNVDELNSWVGLLRDQQVNANRHLLLVEIQDRLFTIGSHLANEKADSDRFQIPEIHEEDVTRLEEAIDQMNEKLPEMKSFILPGGHQVVSYCHITRTVCRRAERGVVALQEVSDEVEPLIVTYLNRLSDYLFVLSRMLTKELNATEVPWVPKK
ncbi:cob(I)yrinic acid a,c-diamide adenosyltransferase [Marivirga atlantica]|jgi:cob(I)alamin adenosyltransferase|uniref:Corrinoid adenosyltransferase n=1 Tax=Marivirga atlantica TaxID=1548457 RepID=A0A937AP90_9BACT|nr:cob(I)yrinic acid a,c-diamide adenosyltransferase [Marivirga atlantica]MBL0766317.1 cob(I)yrinic acid a,c-diamide adenosyltransferase [Marivirga atlantica]